MEITATLTVEDIDLEVIVDYEPPTPAYCKGHPDNWEPADSGYVDLQSVVLTDSLTDISPLLSSELIDQLTKQTIGENTP